MRRLLHSWHFWLPFGIALLVVAKFFEWELSVLTPPTPSELVFTIVLAFFLALSIGLTVWNLKEGTCPVGVKRATGLAWFLGAATLICPACIALPTAFIGIGFALAAAGPYLPLMRVVAIVLLLVAVWMLRPRRE